MPVAPVASDDPALHEPAGSFVTLHTRAGHRLRGCIGCLDASRPLIATVRQSAAGVLTDPRFNNDPIRLDELPDLEIEITVVLPAVPESNVLDFEPQKHGIYLKVAGRSGCFLPQVAQETGWSREQLLSRLCKEKMGLDALAWRSDEARLLRFGTILVGPEPFVV